MKNNIVLETKKLSSSEIEQVSGGSQTMTVATRWSGTVAGFAAGAIIKRRLAHYSSKKDDSLRNRQ